MERKNYIRKTICDCDKCGEGFMRGHFYEDTLFCNECWKKFLEELDEETVFIPEPEYY